MAAVSEVREKSEDATSPRGPMRRRGKWLISALLLAVLTGHAVSTRTGRDYWPFSRYSLYAQVYRPEPFTIILPVGLIDTPGGGVREVALGEANFPPFDEVRISRATLRHYGEDAQDRDAVRRDDGFAASWLATYERTRRLGRHDGPPLAGLRLYHLTWRYHPDARNADDPPDERVLLGQYAPSLTDAQLVTAEPF